MHSPTLATPAGQYSDALAAAARALAYAASAVARCDERRAAAALAGHAAATLPTPLDRQHGGESLHALLAAQAADFLSTAARIDVREVGDH